MSILKNDFAIEDLKTRRKQSLLRLMYTQSKKDENIVVVNKHMKLRSDVKVKLKSDFTRLTKIQKSPYYRGLGLWNILPEDIQKEQVQVKFKEKVKLFIKD